MPPAATFSPSCWFSSLQHLPTPPPGLDGICSCCGLLGIFVPWLWDGSTSCQSTPRCPLMLLWSHWSLVKLVPLLWRKPWTPPPGPWAEVYCSSSAVLCYWDCKLFGLFIASLFHFVQTKYHFNKQCHFNFKQICSNLLTTLNVSLYHCSD